MAAATTNAHQPAGLTLQTLQERWTPSLPTNLMTLLNPFAAPSPDKTNDNADPSKADVETQHHSHLKRPILSAVQFDDMSTSQPPSPTRSSASIMFAEPDTRSTSEDGSREGSIDAKRFRRNTRPKTRYSLCHPVPESKVKQKLHRQPRSLLQLHRLQTNARPLPAIEVIPSANFSVKLIRSITKVFKAKHGFCTEDLVVLKAEKYGTQDDEAEARDVIGLICRGSKEEQKSGSGRMLIHMASGKQWEAYSMSNGGYECCTTDEHGLKETVRWVPKKNKDGRGVSSTRKFNFSTISPHTRRHPVIANLQKTGLDINDSYRIPDPLVTTPVGTPKTSTMLEDAFEEETGDNNECMTDDATREIITVTGIWVAMREGWSPNFKYDDKRDSCGNEGPNSPMRSVVSPVPSAPGSPARLPPLDKRASAMSFGSGIMRRASMMSRRSNRNSTASVREESDAESPAPSRSASVNLGPSGRSRADSSATVLVHRAASNRRKKTEALASFRPDLACENDLHETSREDLAIVVGDSRKIHRLSAEPLPKPKPSPLTRKSASSSPPARNNATEGGEDASPAKGRARSITPEDNKSIHRASLTTNGSTSTRHRRQSSHPMPEFRTKKKHKLWRKLLCGSSTSD